jgi:predicted nucleotidyltransferase
MISLRSEITRKVLNYFFVNPGAGLYVNELSRMLNLDKRNLVKKLKILEAGGVLISQIRGNLKIYSINKKFPLYKEYKKIILTTVGLEHRIREIVESVPGVKEAYLYGSFAENTFKAHSDIDLLVIGSHGILELQRKINPFQNEIGRDVNIVNMDEREFRNRIAHKDPFLANVFSGKLVKLR